MYLYNIEPMSSIILSEIVDCLGIDRGRIFTF